MMDIHTAESAAFAKPSDLDSTCGGHRNRFANISSVPASLAGISGTTGKVDLCVEMVLAVAHF
jgi:hypothetical protein